MATDGERGHPRPRPTGCDGRRHPAVPHVLRGLPARAAGARHATSGAGLSAVPARTGAHERRSASPPGGRRGRRPGGPAGEWTSWCDARVAHLDVGHGQVRARAGAAPPRLRADDADDGFSEPRADGRWGWRADLVAELLADPPEGLLFFAGCTEEQVE